MNARRLLLISLILLPALAWSQKQLHITSSVEDYITREPIHGSSVGLLSADSTVIDTTTAKGIMMSNGKIVARYANFYFKISQEGQYLIRVQMEGYDTRIVPIDITKIKSREIERKIPAIYLQRTIDQYVDEVTVTATKIKFYNKGDTVVYNADAFQLSEGSMLDALIRQMPGVELKSDGQIYANGKFVKNLLLNGKDFFKGNNQIMLNNLPTYMVNSIKVYDKAGNLSEFLGEDIGDKETVMDVNLKKQYNIGWLGNVEGGAGTNRRYLGRMFAMRFTDHSQVSFYGNINNTNDTRKPGQDTDWSPEKMPKGLLISKMAGVDYSVNDRGKKFKLNGNAQFRYTDDDIRINTSRTNFLTSGDTYDRMSSSGHNANMHLNTYHNLYFKFNRFDLNLKPLFNYHKYHNKGSLFSATSAENLDNFDKEQLDSLYTPGLSRSLQDKLLNRNLRTTKDNGSDWNGELWAYSTIKMKNSPDALMLDANISIKGAKEDAFQQNRVDYLAEHPTTTDFRNQYDFNKPGNGYNYSLKASYLYRISAITSLTFHYSFGRNYTSASRSLYRLDKLYGWGEDTNHDIGELPSTEEYLNTMDMNNSFTTRFQDNIHSAGLFFNWNKIVKGKGAWWAQVNIPMAFHDQQLKYQRASVDTTMNRRTALLDINSTFIQWQTSDSRHRATLAYTLKSKAPDMTYLVDIKDDSDPLNIRYGNADLKNSYNHIWDFSYNNRRADKQRQINLYLSYAIVQNALAMGYVYDKTTGVRTITPDNVNGNWNGSVQMNYSTPIDKKKLLTFSNIISAVYDHNVDLISVEDIAASNRSVVKTLNLTETFKWDYKLCQHLLTAKAGVTWTHANGNQHDFKTINAVNYNYGVIAQLKLPWKFKLSTDITMYSRRGYEGSSLNTDDLVWNTRISRPILKERIILIADGFDILNQLTNVQRTLNAQGRTEIRTNVIPRYIMFHAVYRFNIMPKKKK